MKDRVTVKELMETDIFRKKVRLVAGDGGLDRKVTYVTVQEAPDFHTLIDGGEFVLSTWYAFKDNLAAGLEALKNLASKASGVCIKTQRFIDEIPDEYIEYSNEEKLPLFVVDREVNFREIIKCISVEINLSHMNTIIKVNDYYLFLFNAALENGSADFMLSDFLERTGLIAISISTDFKQIRGQRALNKLRNKRARLENIKNIVDINRPCMEYLRKEDCHVFPCVARGYCYGYLIVLSAEELSEIHKLYITQLRNIITIKWLDRQEKENDLLLSMMKMIIQAPENNVDYIQERLKEKSIDISKGLRAAILKYDSSVSTAGKPVFGEVQQLMLHLSALLPNLLFIWNRSDTFTILMGEQGDDVSNVAPDWLQSVSSLLRKHVGVKMGIGPAVSRIDEIRTSVRFARNVLIFADESAISYYGDHLLEMVLLSGSKSRESDFLIERVIEPLVSWDEKNDGYVMETLDRVVRTGDLSHAAKELCVHVNSVRYRLQKIKPLTGLDFFNISDRYMILTAFTMYKNRHGYLLQKY